uniref:Uncharacterized protein n=1 Tax=Chrysemys picta bellii TaxID=8478 RepID=A0A8C3IN76_CHRPI
MSSSNPPASTSQLAGITGMHHHAWLSLDRLCLNGYPPVSRLHMKWLQWMRVQAASIAFLSDVPSLDICVAATWSSIHTFMNRYAITASSRADASFGGGSPAILV